MDAQICETCGTRFLGGVHYWAGTGNKGNPRDLAGLICNQISAERSCINPCRGQVGGDTFEKRLGRMKQMDRDLSKLA